MCDFFLDWDDFGILGGLSEELADEELKRRRLENEREEEEAPEK